jgi:hypothetical protein
MATVSEIAVEYAARGASAAQRADRNVRESIKTTAETARQESGTISRWAERHQRAIQMIGVATAGVMASILAASPTMRSELAGVRLAFSLLADTIVRDVLPSAGSVSGAAFKITEAYRNLPGPVRRATSALLFFGLIGGTLLGTLAALQSLFAGTFVATLGAKAIGAISGAAGALFGLVSASTAAAVAIGLFAGLVGVAFLETSGFLDLVQGLGQWVGNKLPGFARDGMLMFISVFLGPLAVVGGAIRGFVKGFLKDGLRGGIKGAVDGAQRQLDIFVGAWNRQLNRVWDLVTGVFGDIKSWLTNSLNPVQWGKNIMNSLIDGIKSKIPDLSGVVEGAADKVSSVWPGSDAERGPLSNWTDQMAALAEGPANAVEENQRRLGRASRDSAGAVSGLGAGGGGGGGGTSVEIVIERGAIQMRSTPGEPGDFDTAELAGDIFDEADRRYGGQTTQL